MRGKRYSSEGFGPSGFFGSCCGSAAGGARCSAASGPRPWTWVLRALYCIAGCGGVFAQAGTMSSTLLLPEQAASSAARTDMTTMRTMTAVLAIGCPPMRTNEDSRTFELRQTLRRHRSARDAKRFLSVRLPPHSEQRRRAAKVLTRTVRSAGHAALRRRSVNNLLGGVALAAVIYH